MCAFMPKYHWFPFFDDDISGSRLLLLVLGRRRGRDQRRIHDRAAAQHLALGLEVFGHGRKDRLRQSVALEQMAEIEDRRLVRNGVAPSKPQNVRIDWMS